MLELKVILALVVRKFSFREGYEELARRKGAKGALKRPPRVLEVPDWGGRAYFVSLASSKPKEGIPVWIGEVEREGEGERGRA
jgi:hypothetical protein